MNRNVLFDTCKSYLNKLISASTYLSSWIEINTYVCILFFFDTSVILTDKLNWHPRCFTEFSLFSLFVTKYCWSPISPWKYTFSHRKYALLICIILLYFFSLSQTCFLNDFPCPLNVIILQICPKLSFLFLPLRELIKFQVKICIAVILKFAALGLKSKFRNMFLSETQFFCPHCFSLLFCLYFIALSTNYTSLWRANVHTEGSSLSSSTLICTFHISPLCLPTCH